MFEFRNHNSTILIKLIYGLIIFTILSRLAPHPYNFTSVGALSLFAGATLSSRTAWLVTVVCLVISDAFSGFYNPVVMLFVYLGFVLNTFLGHYLLNANRNFLRITIGGLLGAFIFYFVSNFGMWLSGLNYPLTWAGLIDCYIQGLPYIKPSLMGDLIYAYFCFGIFHIIEINMRANDHTMPIR